MEERVTERDIHSILDQFGQSGEETPGNSATLAGGEKEGPAVWFGASLQRSDSHTESAMLPSEENDLNGLNAGLLRIKESVDKDSDEDGDMSSNIHNQWLEMFGSIDSLEMLKESAAAGKLGSTYFRSICWRLFWECLPEEQDEWITCTQASRQDYEALRVKHLTDPYESGAHHDLSVNNPLSQAEESPWHQYFQDNELRTTLNQDLDRLFPEHHFFQKAEIKKTMLHILFCFAREHPLLNYRQGMHEILACIVHVFWMDYSKVSSCSNISNKSIFVLHNLDFIEHDCYHLFRHLMDVIEPWYINVSVDVDPITRSKVTDASNLFTSPPSMQTTSSITKKLNRIQSFMLKRYDFQLYSFLKQLDIQPQLYGIRWLRLLFGREFDLRQLPLVWDVIFSQGITLDFADYIFLAMLIHIRGQMLKADYATCLSYLMKYPCSEDLRVIIRKAFFLRNHKPSTSHAGGKKKLTHKLQGVPKEHPVKARLRAGISEEQKFASALGSSTIETSGKSASKSRKVPISWPSSDSRGQTVGTERRGEDVASVTQDEDLLFEEQEGRKEFVRDPDDIGSKQSISGHLTNVFGKHKVGSPSQIIAKLATKTKSKNKGDILSQLAEDHQRLQQQVSLQQREIERLSYLNMYCGEKMDAYLSILQKRLSEYDAITDEAVSLCIAGLKQIKEFLKGSSETRAASAELDIDLSHIDKHLSNAIGNEMPPCNISEALEATYVDQPIPETADYDHFLTHKTTKGGERTDGSIIGVTASNEVKFSPGISVEHSQRDDQPRLLSNLRDHPLQRDSSSDLSLSTKEATVTRENSVETTERDKQNDPRELLCIKEPAQRYFEGTDSSETDSIQSTPKRGSNENATFISPLHDCQSDSDILLFEEELSSISSRFSNKDA